MLTLELQATPEEVMRAVDALEDFCQAEQLPKSVTFGLTLALEECGSNVINHALQRDANQTFRVTVERTAGEIVIELRDRGPEFDPTKAVEKDASDEDSPGGWGIQLVRRYTDEARYQREAGQNILRLSKRLGGTMTGN
ncbi:MAG TPA: ATP-binding protein [Verrucomicrobiae bacterium]|jgi:anti-sigma regulatory factor (Ser/Thr protein kinase)|nr:ATP-binding protein [Verrucomicrobiae bacterium]